jgi:hypothetical protein
MLSGWELTMAAVQGFVQTFLMAIFVIALAVTLGFSPPSGRSASQPAAPSVAPGATTALL